MMEWSGLKSVRLAAMCCLFLWLCLSCSNKKEQKGVEGSINVDEYEFQNTGTLTDWTCFDVNADKVCVPNAWNKVDNHSFHFFSYLTSEKNRNRFFVVVKYDTAAVNLDLREYLREVVAQVKADTHEIAREGSFRRLTFENSPPCYYSEFVTEIQDQQHYTFSIYTVRFGSLFDFTLKTHVAEKESAYSDFQNVLFNYKIGKEYLFRKEDPILSIDLIDPNSSF